MKRVFNRMMSLFKPGDHSSAIESIFSSLQKTTDDNHLPRALFFTTRHVPRTLLVEKGAHRSRPAITSPSTWCARQCQYCVRKGCPRLERARPNLHSRARSALQDRRPLDHGLGAYIARAGRRRHLTVLQRQPEGRDKPPEEVRYRARTLDRRIRPGQVRGWSPLWRCRRLWSFLATPYPTGPTIHTTSYSSSSLRSPSSSPVRSASVAYVKEKVSNTE